MMEYPAIGRSKAPAAKLPAIFIGLALILMAMNAAGDSPVSGGPTKPSFWWSVGDPVSVNSGAYYFSMPLLSAGGPLPLTVTLNYRTDASWFGLGVPVAANNPAHFQHNLLPAMEAFQDGDTVKVSIEPMTQGELIRFNSPVKGGLTEWTLQEPSPNRYALVKTAAGYYWLMDPREGKIYIFAPDALYGYRILAYQDRNENRWTYLYSKNGLTPTRMQDGLGRTLDFTFAAFPANDYRKALTKITDQSGRTINYEPVLLRYYASVTDPLGQRTAFSYDATDILTQMQRPRGNVPYRQTYANAALNRKTAWRVASQTDALGNVTTFAYDAAATRVTTRTPDQTTTVYESFGNNGPIGAITDPSGKKMTFGQTPQGQTSGVTDRLGRATTYTYHPESGKIASVTNAKGRTIAFTYAPQVQTFTNPAVSTETASFTFYNLAKIDYPDLTSEQFTYDGKGNLLTRKDRTGAVTSFTYNTRGQVLTVSNPAGGVQTYTYNDDGTLSSQKDTDTGVTTFQYDNTKRPDRINRPDGTVKRFVYDLNDQITAVTDELGRTTRFAYDSNGNLTQVTDAAGKILQYGYDQMDRLVSTTNRLGKTSNYAYDSMGRIASATDPSGLARSFSYDPRGWRNRVTQGGQNWQMGYNEEGGLTSITTPLGDIVRQSIDPAGLRSGFTYATGGENTIGRDGMNRIINVTDPLSRSMQFGYDAGGLLTDVTLPAAGTARFGRNSAGAVVKITDLNNQDWVFTRSPMGRLLTATDPLGQVRQSAYDSRGRLSQVMFPGGESVAIQRDGAGNPIRIQYSKGPDLAYAFDGLNRLTGANDIELFYNEESRIIGSRDAGISCGAVRDNAGRVTSATYANGAFSVNYAYDPATGLLSSVTDTLTGSRIQFAYDRSQRMTQMNRSNGIDTAFSWNASSWLTRQREAKSGSSPLIDIQNTLDAAGQVTRAQTAVPLDPASLLAGGSRVLAYDAASQAGSAGFRYDARGRLTADPGQSYLWDGASRLIGAGNATLTYNGLGDLRTRTSGGKTTRFYYNHALGLKPPVAEQDASSNQFTRYYVWTPDGTLLYTIDAANGNRVYFYHFDRAGSTLALTDGSGAVADSYAYTPYGAVLGHQGTSTQPFTYGGRYGVRQEGSGGALFQMRARYYDALTGRFLTREPLWPNLNDPRQLNPYSYAAGNPVNYVDVTGREPLGVLEGTTFTESVFTVPQNTINGVQYPVGYTGPRPISGLVVGPPYGTPPPPVPPQPPVVSGIPIVQSFCSWTEAQAKSAFAISAMAQFVVSQAFAQNVFSYWNRFLIAMISAWGTGEMISTTIPASWVSESNVGLEGVPGGGDYLGHLLGTWDPDTIFIVQ